MQSKITLTKGASKVVENFHSSNNLQQRQARRILTEEAYTGTLSTIISRDYFPSLQSLQRDAAVLEKRSQGDIAGAVAIRRQARKLALHEEDLAEQERMEEQEAIMENDGIRKRARPLHRETVDGFHARVTSEDNHDFEVEMRTENRERRERMNIIYNSVGTQYSQVPKLLESQRNNNHEDSSERQISRTLAETPMMASDEFTAPTIPLQLAGGDGTAERNSLFFSPAHRSETLPIEQQGRQLNLQLEQNVASANLEDSIAMPPPSSFLCRKSEQLCTKYEVKMKAPVGQMVEYTAKRSMVQSNKKHTIPANTRFVYQNESRLTKRSDELQQTSRLHGTSLNEYESDSTSTDLDAPQRPLAFERQAREKRIYTERNNLVVMTPVIVPKGRDDDPDSGFLNGNQSPIMTWGDVASTPLAHGGEGLSVEMANNSSREDLDSKVFQLPKVDRRENHACVAEIKLAGQIKKFKEANVQGKPTNTTRIESSRDGKKMKSTYLDRKKSLTPAARSLLERSALSSSSSLFSCTKSKINARESSSLSSALRSSYTPKHNVRSSLKRKKGTVYEATPLSVGVDKEVEVSESKRKITISGLLNIP
jgi:protein DGCR14